MIPARISFRGALPRIIRHAGGDLGRRVRPLVARQLLHARHLLRARVQGAAARKLGLPQRSRLCELVFRHVNTSKSDLGLKGDADGDPRLLVGQLEDGGGGGSFGEGGGSAASRHHGGIVEHRQNYRLSGLPEGVNYEVIIFYITWSEF